VKTKFFAHRALLNAHFCFEKEFGDEDLKVYVLLHDNNLFLGGSIKIVTPQVFETHPTSGQHKPHI
jgi:hypothetical protein